MRREITKEEYEEILKFHEQIHEQMRQLPKPKKVYDAEGNVYYEIPEPNKK